MARSIFGLFTGIISAVLVISLVEMMSLAVYTPPDGYDPADLKKEISLPLESTTGELILVIIAFALGSMAGGLLVGIIGGKKEKLVAFLLGSFLMVLGFFKLIYAPEYPLWFWIMALGVFIPFALMGLNISDKIPKRTSGIMPN